MAGGKKTGRRFSIRKADGKLIPRHNKGLDPGLAGLKAFHHPSVGEWWRWLRSEYAPRYPAALITPCSSVKPYTQSPMSRKIRGLLRRLGLWDPQNDRPIRLEWLYFSDLLILVPYERAEDYPACCYELPPDAVLESSDAYEKVAGELAGTMTLLAEKGLEHLVVYLPRKHMRLWARAREKAHAWPRETIVKYSIFSTKPLEETLARLLIHDEAKKG